MANYTTLVNSTNDIAQDLKNFNDSSVASIDSFSLASHAGNRVALFVEYTDA